MHAFFAQPGIMAGRDQKQPGTIVILTKYLDTPTKIPTIHLRTSTVGFHMAPVTWSHRDPTIGLHSTNNIIRFFMTYIIGNHRTPSLRLHRTILASHMTPTTLLQRTPITELHTAITT